MAAQQLTEFFFVSLLCCSVLQMESLPLSEGLVPSGKESLTSSVLVLSDMMGAPDFAETCLSPLGGSGGKRRPTPLPQLAVDELEDGEIPSEDSSDGVLDLRPGLLEDDEMWSPIKDEGPEYSLGLSLGPDGELPAIPGHTLSVPGSHAMAAALQAIPDLQIPLGELQTVPDIVREIRRSLLDDPSRAGQMSAQSGVSQGSSLGVRPQSQVCHLAATVTQRGGGSMDAPRRRPGEGYLLRNKARRAR